MNGWKMEVVDRGMGYVFYSRVVGNKKFRVFTDRYGRSRVQFSTFGKNSVMVYHELLEYAATRTNKTNTKLVDRIIEHIPTFFFED